MIVAIPTIVIVVYWEKNEREGKKIKGGGGVW
jgi:hypothetical protein